MAKIKTYNLRLQDFTPFVGPLIYQKRNWKRAKEKRQISPNPYEKYFIVGAGLTILDILTGTAIVYGIFKGLEALIK